MADAEFAQIDRQRTPKPVSAYLLFASKKRDQMKTENPNISFTELAKLLGDTWINMSDEEKAEYTALAEDKGFVNACEMGHVEKVERILARHPALANESESENGFTALMLASRRNHEKVVELLLDHGADRDVRTPLGKTALDFATTPAMQDLLRYHGGYLLK